MLSLSLHTDCSTNHLLLGPDPIVHLQNSINGNELPLDLFNPSLRAKLGTSGENVIVENDHIIDEIQKEDPDEHLKFLETGGKPKQAISLIAKKDIQKLEIIIQNEIKPSTFINIKSFNEIFKIILPQLFLDNESGKKSKVRKCSWKNREVGKFSLQFSIKYHNRLSSIKLSNFLIIPTTRLEVDSKS